MTHHDEDLGYPGNRETLERELNKATTQVLFLAQEPGRGHQTLAERGADAVRGMELLPSEERFWTEEPSGAAVAAAAKDGIPADIAEAYLRAKTEVKVILGMKDRV